MTAKFENAYLCWDPSGPIPVLKVRGEWTLGHYQHIGQQLSDVRRWVASHARAAVNVHYDELAALDTAGGFRLYELLGEQLLPSINARSSGLSDERHALLETIVSAHRQSGESPATSKPAFVTEVFARAGLAVEQFYRQTVDLLGFMGVTLEALARNLLRPRTWRVTPIVAQIEETGFNAVPIVALLTFMVGAVVAFLGATILADFGATIYTVHLVSFSFLREFAVLLTAIMIAGRTASAFTAQLGSMKSNEEIDAIRTMGLSPIDMLVLPRVLALLISMPLLTFIGMVSGIGGGMLVCALALDISPQMFLSIFNQEIPLVHFVLGMAKAPVFAFIIGLIGCLEGFKVSGSAQSVGEHTTSAVVQSIFVVILLDAFAALFFMEMGW